MSEWILYISNSAVMTGIKLLIQSGIALSAGLFAVYVVRKKGATVQSVVLKGFFVAFILSSPVSIMIHNTGTKGLTITVPVEKSYKPASQILPAEVTNQTTGEKKTPQTYNSHHPDTIVNNGISSQKTASKLFDIPKTQKAADSLGTLKTTLPVNNAAVPARSSAFSESKPSNNNLPILYILLTGVWAVASLLLLLRFIADNMYLLYIRLTAVQAKESFIETCTSTAYEMGMRVPSVLQAPEVKSPFAAGIFRPYIVMPMGKYELDLPEKEVFLHELAHLKRHDPFWNQILHIAIALLPFQPLLWVYVRRITETSDYVCDDYVMNYVENHHTYARNLANLARTYHPRGYEITAGASLISIRSSLGRRIARILDATHKFSLRVSARLVFNVSFLCAFTTFVSGLIGIKGKSAVHESYASETKPDEDKRNNEIKSYTSAVPDSNTFAYAKQNEKSANVIHTEKNVIKPYNKESTGIISDKIEDDRNAGDNGIYIASITHAPTIVESENKHNEILVEPGKGSTEVLNTEQNSADTTPEMNEESVTVKETVETVLAETVVTSDTDTAESPSFAMQNRFEQAGSPEIYSGEINDPALKPVDVIITYDFNNADLSDPDEIKKYYMYKSLDTNKMHPVWSPDGKWIAFSDNKYGVWMVPADGGEPRLVYDNYYKVRYKNYEMQIGGLETLGFTPDGKEITFLRYEIDEKLGTEVAVNDLRQPVQITVSNPIPIIVSVNIISGLSRIIAWNATSGRWSYDGRYFTYARKNADSFKELVITDTYTGLEKIIDDLFSVPIIFPMTDAFLLFSESDLYRIKEQSGVMEQLEFNENTTITDISPDGKWILFTDETQGRKQEVYNTETGEQFNVFSDDTIKPYWAKFSPDGTLICFCLYNDDSDTWEIYLYDADFSSEQPLDVEARVPYSFELSGNFPNPFNATTTITFTLPENEFTTFNIYNITGQKIRTLVSEQKTAGTHTVVWDGRDDYGRQLSSGTYITVLKAGTKTATGRMMLVK